MYKNILSQKEILVIFFCVIYIFWLDPYMMIFRDTHTHGESKRTSLREEILQ